MQTYHEAKSETAQLTITLNLADAILADARRVAQDDALTMEELLADALLAYLYPSKELAQLRRNLAATVQALVRARDSAHAARDAANAGLNAITEGDPSYEDMFGPGE